MGLISWLLDQVTLTLSVVSIALPIYFASAVLGSAANKAKGALAGIGVLGIAAAVYYAGYQLAGFPPWMRWLVG